MTEPYSQFSTRHTAFSLAVAAQRGQTKNFGVNFDEISIEKFFKVVATLKRRLEMCPNLSFRILSFCLLIIGTKIHTFNHKIEWGNLINFSFYKYVT